MLIFSFFSNGIAQRKPTINITLPEIINIIQSDKYREVILSLRQEKNKDAKDILKKGLDYVTFSGIFSPTRKVENLVEHSGFLCLDFDHVEHLAETIMQLDGEPYITARFVSPSGTGLKLIIKIDPTRHLDSFIDLGVYFKNTYGLEVDLSGKDVSRACFVSYDSTAYFAPEAEVWTIKGLKPAFKTKSVGSVSPQERTKDDTKFHGKYLKQAQEVVKSIKDSGKDVTGSNHNNWILCGYGLASLGEDGRGLFHEISRVSDKYDADKTDEKYSYMLETVRVISPSIFFNVCKNFGVNVDFKPLKSTVKKSETPNTEGKTKLKKDDAIDDTNDQRFTVWYRDNGSLWVKTAKNWETVAEDFQVFIKYKTEDEDENISWILELRRKEGKPIFIEVPHDDFCSATKLKNIIATKNLSFTASDRHLEEVRGYLFRHTKFPQADKIVRWGFHEPSGVYFFANVAVLGTKKYYPDEFGICVVETPKGLQHLSKPVIKGKKVHRFSLTENSVSFDEFFRVFMQANHYDNSLILCSFYVMSVFRDIAINTNDFSPIMYLKGGAGTGKSSMARIFTSCFGKKQNGVNLKSSNTEASLAKLMSQAANSMIWFDEFFNGFPHEGKLQAAYDNDGYHRSKDSSGIETDNVEIHSSLILTSNYLPQNPIFFSRCVFAPVPSQSFTNEQKQAKLILDGWMEQGLGCLTVELLAHRELIEKEFATIYRFLYAQYASMFKGEQIPDRLFANMAQITTVTYILQSKKLISICENEEDFLDSFKEVAERFIRRQYMLQREETALTSFFEIIQGLYEKNQVLEGIHFKFMMRGTTIYVALHFPKLYNLFKEQYRRINNSISPERDTIKTEIAQWVGNGDWNDIKKQVKFDNDGESQNNSKMIPIKDCIELNYSDLCKEFGQMFEGQKKENVS